LEKQVGIFISVIGIMKGKNIYIATTNMQANTNKCIDLKRYIYFVGSLFIEKLRLCQIFFWYYKNVWCIELVTTCA